MLFIVVVVLVVGWFALGTHSTSARAKTCCAGCSEGLPLIGEKTTLRWLGSSVVELKIQQAKPPFREAEVLVVLEPRDVALLWWIARLRGRRDLLIFRGTPAASAPRLEIVAHDPQTLDAWLSPDQPRRLGYLDRARRRWWHPCHRNSVRLFGVRGCQAALATLPAGARSPSAAPNLISKCSGGWIKCASASPR